MTCWIAHKNTYTHRYNLQAAAVAVQAAVAAIGIGGGSHSRVAARNRRGRPPKPQPSLQRGNVDHAAVDVPAERTLLICLRTIGLVCLRCVYFYAHHHTGHHAGSAAAGPISDGPEVLPCIDAMLRLISNVVASAGVFLLPATPSDVAARSRAPACWVMPFLSSLPTVLQLYDRERPLRASLTPARQVRLRVCVYAFPCTPHCRARASERAQPL